MRYPILYFLLPLLAVSCCSLYKEEKSVTKTVDFENVVALILVESNGITISSGSGTVIDSEKGDETNDVAVLTAKHVIESNEDNIAIKVVLGELSFYAKEAILHPTYDIAVLAFQTSHVLSCAEIDNGNPKPIEEVYAAGYPLQIGLIVSHGIANYETFQSTARGFAPLWLCSAPIYPGNSGGGVFSKESGKLIGVSVMVGAQLSGFDQRIVPHIHFFIPTAAIHSWIKGVNDERER